MQHYQRKMMNLKLVLLQTLVEENIDVEKVHQADKASVENASADECGQLVVVLVFQAQHRWFDCLILVDGQDGQETIVGETSGEHEYLSGQVVDGTEEDCRLDHESCLRWIDLIAQNQSHHAGVNPPSVHDIAGHCDSRAKYRVH